MPDLDQCLAGNRAMVVLPEIIGNRRRSNITIQIINSLKKKKKSSDLALLSEKTSTLPIQIVNFLTMFSLKKGHQNFKETRDFFHSPES